MVTISVTHRFKPDTFAVEGKVAGFTIPFVQALREAYIAAEISDDESATVDLLTDILVYAARAEVQNVDDLAARATRAAKAELNESDSERREQLGN